MKKAATLIVPAVVSACACGCAHNQASKPVAATEDKCTQDPHPTAKTVAGTPINTICPIGKHEVYASAPRAAHKGQVIAFCCVDCLETWNKMNEAQRDALVASIKH